MKKENASSLDAVAGNLVFADARAAASVLRASLHFLLVCDHEHGLALVGGFFVFQSSSARRRAAAFFPSFRTSFSVGLRMLSTTSVLVVTISVTFAVFSRSLAAVDASVFLRLTRRLVALVAAAVASVSLLAAGSVALTLGALATGALAVADLVAYADTVF